MRFSKVSVGAVRSAKRRPLGCWMRCLAIDECREWRDKHRCRHDWKHQTTCITPLTQLPSYTIALVERLRSFDRAM